MKNWKPLPKCKHHNEYHMDSGNQINLRNTYYDCVVLSALDCEQILRMLEEARKKE